MSSPASQTCQTSVYCFLLKVICAAWGWLGLARETTSLVVILQFQCIDPHSNTPYFMYNGRSQTQLTIALHA